MVFLKWNSTADIFPGMSRLFLEKLFHKVPLNNWSGRSLYRLVSQLLIVPWAGLHKAMCQSVIGELLQPLWEYWQNIIKAYTSINPIRPKVFYKKAEKLSLQLCNFTEKELRYRCFQMTFAKFFRIATLRNTNTRLNKFMGIIFHPLEGRIWQVLSVLEILVVFSKVNYHQY